LTVAAGGKIWDAVNVTCFAIPLEFEEGILPKMIWGGGPKRGGDQPKYCTPSSPKAPPVAAKKP
jgi:hypothetical protein